MNVRGVKKKCLQERKGTVDGYEWRGVKGQFDSYVVEYMWRRSNGHKLVDDNFHEFLASFARVYPPTEHDEMQANITARVIECDTSGEIYYFVEDSREFRTRQQGRQIDRQLGRQKRCQLGSTTKISPSSHSIAIVT
ncbi:hypothetical protein TNCV_1795141 [Trichonephila clavipes]|nr:hypothetical protein TNCV_1795141 [Trichonephila clavipes]